VTAPEDSSEEPLEDSELEPDDPLEPEDPELEPDDSLDDDSPLEDSLPAEPLPDDSPLEELPSELSPLDASLPEDEELASVLPELELLPDSGAAFGLERLPLPLLVLVLVWVEVRLAPEVEVLAFLPGKALAATSASTPVSTTLPATSQRLTWLSLRRAASRVWVVWLRMGGGLLMVMAEVGVHPGAELGDRQERQHDAEDE
jgi:hypothetical protein